MSKNDSVTAAAQAVRTLQQTGSALDLRDRQDKVQVALDSGASLDDIAAADLTPVQAFRAAHGTADTWCGAEVDEYLAACDASL